MLFQKKHFLLLLDRPRAKLGTLTANTEIALNAAAPRHAPHPHPELAAPDSTEDRGALAQMVMKLLDHWKLNTEDQASLLGLAAASRATLSRYRRGEPIGANRDQRERVGHLLGIHKNLRLQFPQNRDLAYRWMTQRNLAFNNLTPVDVIKESGFAGLLAVRGYLDKARGV
jgi:hypothetical protein